MLYNPQTYQKKKNRRSSAPVLIVIGLIAATVFGIWKGEEYYYHYFGNKSSRLNKFTETFYYRLEKPGHEWQDILEPLRLGMNFLRKMIALDHDNPEIHYYRSEFQYLLARLELDLDEFKILKFASRPDALRYSNRVARFLRNSRLAALKSVALDDNHEEKLYASYNIAFSYLFSDHLQRRYAMGYFNSINRAGFAPKEPLHELHWPTFLAAMFSGQGALAADSLDRSRVISTPVIKKFLKGLIYFHEKRYTDCLLELEKVSAELENYQGSEGWVPFVRSEAFRYLGMVYQRQNLDGQSKKMFALALEAGGEDAWLKSFIKKKTP